MYNKKIFSVITIILFSVSITAQVCVGTKFLGKSSRPLKGDQLKKVKQSDLVFLKPDYMDADSIRIALGNVWKFGDLIIDDNNSPKYLEYILSGSAIVDLNSYRVTDGSYEAIRSFVDFRTYDVEEIGEKFEKLREKDYDEEKIISKINSSISQNREPFARVMLHESIKYNNSFRRLKTQEAFQTINKTSYFNNFNYGMLRNYVQLIVNEINDDAEKSFFKSIKTNDLEKLRSQTLYIPDHILKKYDAIDGFLEEDEKFAKKVLSGYKNDYEIVSTQDISDMILSGEDFYYLRYVRVITEHFIEVVHSKTGKVIYGRHSGGFAKYNLKSKDLKKLFKATTD